MRELLEARKTTFCSIREDAWDVMVALTGSEELEQVKEKYKDEEGRINMCQALKEMLMEERLEGRIEGRLEGRLEGLREGRIEGRRKGLREGRIERILEGIREGKIGTAYDLFDKWRKRNIS